MSPRPLPRWARGYALAVGAMDLTTGLALLAAPGWTLARMGAAVPGAEALVQLRFTGAFVAAVGAMYLAGRRGADGARLRGALEATLVARLAAGAAAGALVATGGLDAAWLSVAVTDLACAAVQAGMLVRSEAGDA